MFTFFKRRKAELDARTTIGVELHRQIKEAFDQNEMETSARLMTFFTAGYVYGFVRIGFFTLTGVRGEQATDTGEQSIDDSTKHVDNFVRDVIRKHFAGITEALINRVDYKFSDVQRDRRICHKFPLGLDLSITSDAHTAIATLSFWPP